jgi:hypothetical protein
MQPSIGVTDLAPQVSNKFAANDAPTGAREAYRLADTTRLNSARGSTHDVLSGAHRRVRARATIPSTSMAGCDAGQSHHALADRRPREGRCSSRNPD